MPVETKTPDATCIVIDGAAIIQMMKPAVAKTFYEFTQQEVLCVNSVFETKLDAVYKAKLLNEVLKETFLVPLSTISRNLDEDLNQNSIDHDQNDKDRIVPSQDTYDIPGGKGTIDKDVEKGKKTYTENTPVKNNLAYFRKGRYQEKIIFTISVTTLISLALSLMNIHWFLTYYYAISTPVLLVIRVVMYWKSKWQYFLFDFCYFTNVFCFVYIWVVPASSETSVVLFALANGPLAWASVLFRNALALHDMDRMTSCYIHMLPMLMSFGLRWYPDEMSVHWYRRFYSLYPEDVDYMFIWALYLLIVFAICKPDESYLNSLRYLASRRNSCPSRTLYAFGEK
ncbi:hypothetical protein LSH36_192g04030 [Paralvinella palmiformis]|uniref:Glycerophosphocholine acyltransferase 1 n=1 Tax=Paralvinella palmiformis TaxID=53620 RepID=A0AAD9N6M2_9ANNE|nr:hypothetical protein LSH36_192g04030 [Paralvinella palmiformis]